MILYHNRVYFCRCVKHIYIEHRITLSLLSFFYAGKNIFSKLTGCEATVQTPTKRNMKKYLCGDFLSGDFLQNF